jgi:methylated-DNA-protein-cysteine methyltransferase related protein
MREEAAYATSAPPFSRAPMTEPSDPDVLREARRAAVLAVVHAIPRGQVLGYADVARRAGWPRHARLVAKVLATASDPALPWHRVLRSDGRIALPAGSAGAGEQALRLRAEGVELVAGRVRHMTAADDLDSALWSPGD